MPRGLGCVWMRVCWSLPILFICPVIAQDDPAPSAVSDATAVKLPGQLAAENHFPLVSIAADVAKEKRNWTDTWYDDVPASLSPAAEAAYQASLTIDRRVVVDHFQSREFDAAHPNARLNLDIGRHEYLKWACGEALRRANRHMAETKQKPIRKLVIYNSSVVKDFSRDADLTVYLDDENSEKVFFHYLNEVFTQKREGAARGLQTKPRGKQGAYGRGISVEDMEVTFHRGSDEPPKVHAPMDLAEFNIAYRRGVERQADNPEAYIGFGFEQEVQARRTMQLPVKQPALLAQTFTAGDGDEVHCKGQYVTNATEALHLLKTMFGPEFSRAHNAMHVFCDFFQAGHHTGAQEQIDKGPLKYSGRAADALCRLFGYDKEPAYLRRISDIVARHQEQHKDQPNPPAPPSPSVWSVLTEAEKVALLKRVMWRGEDPQEQYDARMRRIAAVLSDDPKARQGTVGQDDHSAMAMIILRRLAAESLRTVAQQMMCPDPTRPDGVAPATWDAMSPQQRLAHNIADAKARTQASRADVPAGDRKPPLQVPIQAAHEDKLSVAAMENLLIAMRLLHEVDLDMEHVREDPLTQNRTQWGALAVDQIIRESSPEMQRVLRLASEHGKLAALMSWPMPKGMNPKKWGDVRKGWWARLNALRFEISQECYAFRDHPERTRLQTIITRPPDDFLRRQVRPGGPDDDLAAVKRLQRRYLKISLGGNDPPPLPPALAAKATASLGRASMESLTDASNIPDVLSLIEMYQNSASDKDYAKFLLSNALSRYSPALGYAWQTTEISAITDDAAREKAMEDMGKGVVFHCLAYFVPAAGQAKLFFDIERGVVMITFGYAVNTLNNGVIDALYTGDAGRDPDLQGSISLKGDLRSNIDPVVPPEFFFVPKGQKKAMVNVVEYYRHLWKKFTELDPDDDFRPPIGQRKRSELVHAHDDYLRLFAERAEAVEAGWFDTVRETAASPSLLFNESTLQQRMRRLMDALEPYAQEEVDRVLNSEVGSVVQPYVQEVNGKKIDVLAEGMKNRLKMDFIAGAQSHWQTRMLQQYQAKQMVENLAVAADVRGLAEELAKGDRILSSGKPLPPFEIRILGPVHGRTDAESADSLKWELDGRGPLALRVALTPLGPLPDDLPEIERELDFGPVEKAPASYRPYKGQAAGPFDYAAAEKDPALWSEQVWTQQVTARARSKATGAVITERTDTIHVRLAPVGLEFEKPLYETLTEEPLTIRLVPKTTPPKTHRLPQFEIRYGDGKEEQTLLVPSFDHAYEKAGEYTVTAKYSGTDMEGSKPPVLLGEAVCRVVVKPRKLVTVERRNITGRDLGELYCFSAFIGYSQRVNLSYTHEEGFPDRPHGAFRITYPDGKPKVEGGFARGRANGEQTQYFNNGKPYKQITFKDGDPVGKSTTWHFGGKIAFESENDDKGDPKWSKTYHEDGTLKCSWEYSGKRSGHYREYWGNGKVSVEYEMKDGYVVPGTSRCYDTDGNLTSTN